MSTTQTLLRVGCAATVVLAVSGCNPGAGMQQQTQQPQQQMQQQQAPQGQQANAPNGPFGAAQQDAQRYRDQRIQIADQAVKNVVQIQGVRQANILVTNRNAYAAAALDSGQSQMTADVERRIAEKVKAADPNIQNVYVSTNPEFVNRVNAYVSEARQGRAAAGFVEQFNEMVLRLFPNAAQPAS